MKKKIFYDGHAEKEFKKFSSDVRKDFDAAIDLLRETGRLEEPDAKKVSRNLFEIRISREGSYRGFYAYVGMDEVVILHFFRKKTQKMPLQNIELAKRRLKFYE